MPYKDKTAERLAARDRQRSRRARLKREALAAEVREAPPPPQLPDPAQAVADWSREALVVPPGHPLAGQPMELPEYGVDFIRDALTHREALLCLGRKNAKSAIVAVFALALMAGPLRRPGLRIGTVSVTREKSAELLRQMREIAEGSELPGLEFRKSPAPGWVVTPDGSTSEFLSADKASGHASGFDYAIVDELGLMGERDRELIAGMRTATSARDGRFLALSIRGESPMLEEMVDRRGLPTTAVHLHAPQVAEGEAVDIHDPAVWAAGNPGIAAGIKSAAWMRDEARRVEATPTDRATFLAFDLNLPQSPTREMIFSPTDWRACVVDELPPRRGPVCLGLDMGEATAASAAFGIWPETGRCESWLAFGDNPPLVERGRRDGARYDLMAERGELRTYPGRVTPVSLFLSDVATDLQGCRVHRLGADGYKDAESKDFLETAGLRWPYEFRRVGAGKDGGRDVRALQRLVLNRRLKMRESLSFSTAISNSALRRDGNGNPGLDKASSRGRIDLLSAAVIAAGIAEPLMDRPARPAWRYRGVA